MSRRTWVHVRPSSGEGGRRTGTGWIVKTGRKGKGKIVSTHSNKRPAVKKGKQYARNSKRRPSTVVIRGMNGQIQDQVSYK